MFYGFILETDFKKASPEDKLGMFNSLLKGYQEEVDNITKRAKFGENAFLNIYQKLYEAPDPFPALASIAVILQFPDVTVIETLSHVTWMIYNWTYHLLYFRSKSVNYLRWNLRIEKWKLNLRNIGQKRLIWKINRLQ